MEERIEQLADLTTLGNGAALEKFGHELAKVVENIRDPNTDAKAKRKIILEIVFLPQEDREAVATLVAARCVLASTKPSSDLMFVGRREGKTIATVLHGARDKDPRQGILPIDRKAGEP